MRRSSLITGCFGDTDNFDWRSTSVQGDSSSQSGWRIGDHESDRTPETSSFIVISSISLSFYFIADLQWREILEDSGQPKQTYWCKDNRIAEQGGGSRRRYPPCLLNAKIRTSNPYHAPDARSPLTIWWTRTFSRKMDLTHIPITGSRSSPCTKLDGRRIPQRVSKWKYTSSSRGERVSSLASFQDER